MNRGFQFIRSRLKFVCILQGDDLAAELDYLPFAWGELWHENCTLQDRAEHRHTALSVSRKGILITGTCTFCGRVSFNRVRQMKVSRPTAHIFFTINRGLLFWAVSFVS